MNKKETLFVVLFVLVVSCLFFGKVIFLHQIPFPGDLLIDTSPFKTTSYLGYAPGGYPNKAQGRDVITQSYPWKLFSIQQLKMGKLPLWNPHNFSGNPHIANFQSGIFYPLNILFFIFSFPLAWTLFIIFQTTLAVIFTYIFLKSLKLSLLPALIGGFAFAFSSYMTVWLEYGNIDHTVLWLPLMLFAVRKYIFTQKFFFAVLFIMSGVCCLLAGYIQGAFYVFLVTCVYALCLLVQGKNKKAWILTPLLFIIAVAAAAIQIMPTLVLFAESTRGTYTSLQIQNLLNPWYYWITLFSSEFFGNPATRNFYLPITYFERVMYVGIPILFFALYAFQKVKSFEVRFFASFAAVSLIVTTNFPGISWIYSFPLPVLSTTVPTRFLSIFIFSVVIIASIGIDYWIRKKDLKSFAVYVFAVVYLLIWIGIFIFPKIYPSLQANITIAKHNFILSTALAIGTLFIFFLRSKTAKISSVLVALLIIFDLFYVFTKFTPFSPVSLLFPQTQVVSYLQKNEGIYRSWGYGSAYIPANYATAMNINSADGYDALHNKDYNILLNSSVTGKVQLPLSRGDANIAPGSGFVSLSDNIYRQKILNLLGIKYILHIPFSGNVNEKESGVFPETDYKLIWHDTSYQVYENLHVYPRFFLAKNYEIVNKKNDIAKIYTTDLRNTILLYQKPEKALNASASGNVVLNTYQPNTVSFTTNTSDNELLFLSDTYDEGWYATIDGKTTNVYQADVAFRAVEVPKGNHTIIFFYQPKSFDIGMAISLFMLTVGGSYLVTRKLFKFPKTAFKMY